MLDAFFFGYRFFSRFMLGGIDHKIAQIATADAHFIFFLTKIFRFYYGLEAFAHQIKFTISFS